MFYTYFNSMPTSDRRFPHDQVKRQNGGDGARLSIPIESLYKPSSSETAKVTMSKTQTTESEQPKSMDTQTPDYTYQSGSYTLTSTSGETGTSVPPSLGISS